MDIINPMERYWGPLIPILDIADHERRFLQQFADKILGVAILLWVEIIQGLETFTRITIPRNYLKNVTLA